MPPARKPTGQQRVPSGDTTGRQTQRLAQKHAEEVAARAGELSMTKAAALQDDSVHDPVVQVRIPDDSVADYSAGPTVEPAPPPRPDPVEDVTAPRTVVVEEVPEETKTVDETVVVRAAENVEEMVYGDPYVKYSFVAGKRYRVPVYLAKHLAERGLIYR